MMGQNVSMKIKKMAFSTYHEVILFELRGALRRYNKIWEEVMCREPGERPGYLMTIEHHRIAVVVLACALLETAINFYLGTKCDSRAFQGLRNKRGRPPSLFEKWAELPGQFVAGYQFDERSRLGKDLKELIKRRNAIMHSRPMLSIDDDNRHRGNEPSFKLDEHEFVGRCASLPFRLIEHLLKFDDAFPEMFSLRTYCATASSEFENAQFRISNFVKRFPLLVDEIMEQGHEKEKAAEYARLIGSSPVMDREGKVLVTNGKRFLVLKPLRFFGKSKFDYCLPEFGDCGGGG